MTQFEEIILAFLASIFGEEVAKRIMCRCYTIIAILAFAGYLCTLPFRFVYYFSKNMAVAK